MTDAAALLAAVLDRPEDDTPRLVFADWLDDHGGEAGGRQAAFIRLHVSYGREARVTYRNRMRPRIQRALAGCVAFRDQQWVNDIVDGWRMGLSVDGWKYTVGPFDQHAAVRRGFVSEVQMPAERFFAKAADLFAAFPLDRVELYDTGFRLEIDPPGGDYGWQVYVYDRSAPGVASDDYTDFIGGLDTREEMVDRVAEFARGVSSFS